MKQLPAFKYKGSIFTEYGRLGSEIKTKCQKIEHYHFSNIYTYISTEVKWQVIKTHFTNTYSTNIYHSYYVSWEETHSLVDERLWVLLGVADFEISLIIQENSHKTLPWLWRKCQRLNFYAVFIPFQYSYHLNLIHLNYQCICLWIVVKC